MAVQLDMHLARLDLGVEFVVVRVWQHGETYQTSTIVSLSAMLSYKPLINSDASGFCLMVLLEHVMFFMLMVMVVQ